ncbi:xanthine dehydrogenase family protein molybdopterin-binding subunit [Chelatococcus reniformis]|uniref:Carbon monoxide dehydrogenase n=1 Tax=Chelatococcus reniformis TaxID=1494448 RepID=A0A916TX73_9HYPH|nr:xanthine dehydrogenase family protein molybdopterin-binding subunit [Chelatococcus reniformis]GGC45445.1 carbon monoxide dehydrogenase [Chelatococcus reniformis]
MAIPEQESAANGTGPALSHAGVGTAAWVGRDIPRKDADRFVLGHIDYTADMIAPGTLRVAIVRSSHAHARIGRIDTAAASAAPGVVAVFTGADVRACSAPMPTRVPRERFPGPVDIWCLAADEVLYVGQPIAAVVATSLNDAEAAKSLVEIDYDMLEPVLDAAAALAPGGALARADWPTNVVARDTIRQGDLDRAFQAAFRTVGGEISFGSGTSAPMEPRCYIADWDDRASHLTLHGTLQQPHPTRWMLAQVLGLREAQIRVVAPPAGGTFGLKMVGHPEEALVAILSRELKRPVAFLESREECFLANAREQTHRFEIAADAQGRIIAFRNTIVADVGAIGAGGGWVMAMVTPTVFPTVYDVPNVAVDAVAVTTNKPPWQGIRGYGKETANLVMERAVELIAVELGMSSIEVRRRNLLPKQAFPHRLPSGLNLDSGDYAPALDQLLDLFPLDEWRQRQQDADSNDKRIGIGFAFDLTPEGASFPGSMQAGFETSTVTVDPTGTVRVATSVTSPGGGNETGIAQIVADVFGLLPDDVTIIQGDTDITPFGTGNTSSRSLMFGGAAAVLAARELKSRVAACAATLLQAEPGELVFAQGRICVDADADRSVPFKQAVSTIYTHAYSIAADIELPLQVIKTYRSPNIRHVPDEFGRISAYPSFPYSVHAAAIEIDVATAQVRVLDYAAIHDCGVVVNPGLVEGQFRGAVAMGIGAALWEELLYDESGATRTNRFKSYVLPRAPDLPRIRMGHRVTPSPFQPLGTKGAGESGFGGAMSVITNAIADALGEHGRHVNRVPFKPDRLLPLLAGALS